jgi:hypothetical protein
MGGVVENFANPRPILPGLTRSALARFSRSGFAEFYPSKPQHYDVSFYFTGVVLRNFLLACVQIEKGTGTTS